MNRVVLCAILILGFAIADSADARIFGRRRSTGSSYGSVPAGCSNATAQGVAEIMAKLERVGHFGGNKGYEGCGSGSTPEAAYRNTCYANSGMPTVDSGVAQGKSGRWYCCRRFIR
jgi:hypothetical protein